MTSMTKMPTQLALEAIFSKEELESIEDYAKAIALDPVSFVRHATITHINSDRNNMGSHLKAKRASLAGVATKARPPAAQPGSSSATAAPAPRDKVVDDDKPEF